MGVPPQLSAITARPPRGRPTHVRIDLGALQHNLRRVRGAAPGRRVMAAVKANGYGHGLERVARALQGVDAFGVASLNEALRLREAGITQPIVLLEGFFDADELEVIGPLGLEVVVHHPRQVEALLAARPSLPLAVWLKVDSGMHRLGLRPEAVKTAWERLRGSPAVRGPIGFMTHLANADDRDHPATLRQLDCFESAIAGLPGARAIANSAGVLGWPQTHADWVRPGIMLYGVSPFLGGSAAEFDLRPVMTLQSELIAINPLRRGDAVGYGGTWVCPEDMPVGVVAVGYGDGYPRHAPSGTPVLLDGRRVPLIGRVSMDMITVDLRTYPHARPGSRAVLWGEGLPAEEIAQWAGTIPYELLCGVTPRVEAVEVRGPQSAAVPN